VVEALQLKKGDEIAIEIASDRHFLIARDPSREQALARLRSPARYHRASASAAMKPMSAARERRVLRQQCLALHTGARRPAGADRGQPARQGGAISMQV
jgi:antitoxin component of MazEF toxin-antitoxin module